MNFRFADSLARAEHLLVHLLVSRASEQAASHVLIGEAVTATTLHLGLVRQASLAGTSELDDAARSLSPFGSQSLDMTPTRMRPLRAP